MSATNRGAVRNERDFYATPKSAFEPLLPYIKAVDKVVWEPACGDLRLIKWMRDYGIQAYGSDIALPSDGEDFLKSDGYQDECIVTNPPYSLAFEFCQHSVAMSEHVFLLLRLNFLASQKRREWFKAHEPSALFILSERPSFTGNGKTDATDYAWFYWGWVWTGIFHL